MASSHHSTNYCRPRGFSRTAAATIADPQERIRQILADKSTLVRVRLLAREQWVKKDERPHCVFCERRFRTFSRKLHCRACGEVICSSCNRKRDVQVGSTSSDTLPVRLCFDCIDQALTPPAIHDIDEDEDVEGSFTNSGRVTLSACSSHMKATDGLLSSIDSNTTGSGSGSAAPTDSFVNLELSQYEDDNSVAGDTDRESSYSYDSDATSQDDGDDDEAYGRSARAKSISASTTSTVSSSGSSSSYRSLGFVPEEASLGDVGSLTLSDLDDTQRRAELLKQFNVASLDRQREFDAICQLVSRALHCGVAAVGFMGETAQWYKSKIGISQSQLPREVAFCSQVLGSREATIVLDACKDTRFQHNPLVTGSAHIRFYASMPICDPESGVVLGSVFAMDPQPKARVPSRAMEVLAYASSAVKGMLQLSHTASQSRRSRQDRLRRVFSEPTLTDATADEDDDGDDVRYTKSAGSRGGSLWTSEPPATLSFRKSTIGIKLLDPDSLKSLSRRSSQCEQEEDVAKVLGRSSSMAHVVASTTAEPPMDTGLCEEIRLQIESTQQLLSSFGPRPQKPSGAISAAEVEV